MTTAGDEMDGEEGDTKMRRKVIILNDSKSSILLYKFCGFSLYVTVIAKSM